MLQAWDHWHDVDIACWYSLYIFISQDFVRNDNTRQRTKEQWAQTTSKVGWMLSSGSMKFVMKNKYHFLRHENYITFNLYTDYFHFVHTCTWFGITHLYLVPFQWLSIVSRCNETILQSLVLQIIANNVTLRYQFTLVQVGYGTTKSWDLIG